MGYTGIGGHQPGFMLNYDRKGNVVDRAASISERWIELGYTWRIGDGYKTLANSGDKRLITFKTPTTGDCYYGFASVSKSGGELLSVLNEGGTVANGSAITPYNLNRNHKDDVCPITVVKGGLSTDASAMAVTGGVNAPSGMLSGSAAGASAAPGASSSSSSFIRLLNNTVYTIVLEAKGAVTCTAFVDIAIIPA